MTARDSRRGFGPCCMSELEELARVIAAAERWERQDLTADALADFMQTAAEVIGAGFRKVESAGLDPTLTTDARLRLQWMAETAERDLTLLPEGSQPVWFRTRKIQLGEAAARFVADELRGKGWIKPRTITTAEELDALPVGSVVLSEVYHNDVDGMAISFQRWYDGDWHRGSRCGDTHPDNFLPATVLHEGGQS